MDAVRARNTGAKPLPPPPPSIARALLAAAVVPASGPWAVSWWQGDAGGAVLAGRGRQLYPDAGALAAELETYMAEPRPKGEGAALACAVFGREGAEGADSDEAAGVVKRRACDVTRWTAVQLDAEPRDGLAPPPLPVAWGVLVGFGVAVVAHPSPSSGHEGDRWRAWLRVADHDGDGRRGVSPWAQLGARVLLACAVSIGLGPVDPAPSKPEALGYVHPRPQVGPRPAGGVRWTEGGALDLEALGRAAVAQGIAPHPRARTTEGGGWDGAALLALAEHAGLVRGAADHRGWVATECPRAHEHSGPGGRLSTAMHPSSGRWRCLHSHELGAREMVDAAMGQLPADAAKRLGPKLRPDDVDRPSTRARGRLAAGAAPPTVAVDAAGEAVVSAAVSAVREGGAVLVRATVGAGKSHGIPAVVDRLAPPPVHVDRPEAPPAMGLPAVSAVVVAPTREGRAELAARMAVHEGGRRFLPVVYRAVTDHHHPPDRDHPDGKPVCIHHARAEALEASGASVRRSLCFPSPEHACERHGECPAEHPWRTLDGLTPDPLDPRALVAVATHDAPPPRARAEAVLVVDEACRAAWDAAPLSPESLAAARRFAAWLSPHLDGAAAVALVRALQHRWGEGIAATPPEARGAILEALAAELAAAPSGHLASLARAAAPEAPDAAAAILEALRGWVAGSGAWALAPRVKAGRSWRSWRDEGAAAWGGAEAGKALRAVRAWWAGAVTAPDDGPDAHAPDDGPGSYRVAVPRTITRTVAGWRGPVVGLDATGDARVWEAMRRGLAPSPTAAASPSVDVVVGDAGPVRRVVVAHARATSTAMLAPGGAVRWTEVAPALAAVVRVVAAWRAEHPDGPCPVALVSRQPIARALRAWWAAGDASPQNLEHAAAAEAEGASDPARWRLLLPAILRGLADNAEARAALEALRAVPGVTLADAAWWGGTAARGSNALMGARVFVALGDACPTPAESTLRATITGTTPDDAAEALAAESAEQWYGRARAVRRAEPLLFVHAGERPPSTWRQHGDDAARVVAAHALTAEAGLDTARGVVSSAPPPEAHRTEPKRTVPALEARALAPTPLATLRAAGWAAEHVAVRVGVDARTVRRWEKGDRAPDAYRGAILAALAAGIASGPLAAVAGRVRALLAGRGVVDVWLGPERLRGASRAALSLRAALGASGAHDAAALGARALDALAGELDSDATRTLAAGLQRRHPSGRSVLAWAERARGRVAPPDAAGPVTIALGAAAVDVLGAAGAARRPHSLAPRAEVGMALRWEAGGTRREAGPPADRGVKRELYRPAEQRTGLPTERPTQRAPGPVGVKHHPSPRLAPPPVARCGTERAPACPSVPQRAPPLVARPEPPPPDAGVCDA